MNGTEWTEPGQGARVMDIRLALHGSPQFSHRYDGNGVPIAQKAYGHLVEWQDSTRTNLRLTGAPLTQADIERIAVCK